MKTIKVKVYQFSELDEQAKDKAREWARQGVDLSYVWDDVCEDAKNVGLKIISLDQHRPNKGSFERQALYTANMIIKDHGEKCSTYKTAKEFLDSFNKLGDEPDYDENYSAWKEWTEKMEELDEEFLESLLSDYFYNAQKDEEFQFSDEAIDENIEANEYTFTKDGKRFG